MTSKTNKNSASSFFNIDSHGHVTGRSIYLDDLPELQGSLYAAVFSSTVAHANILSIDLSKALQQSGVVRIFTYKDIPGENQIGSIIPDEPLLAEHAVHYIGQPIALVIAESERQARAACAHISVQFEPLAALTKARKAQAAGQIIGKPRTFRLGDTQTAFASCHHITEGRTYTGGQEQLYLETQAAYACPREGAGLRIHSSTQGPTAVQRSAARVLDLPMHLIEVDVTRLGGGFGGKEDQATPWAVMAALAAHDLQGPIKLVLHRMDDMYMTGKRHPYDADFKIGLDENLKILAFEAVYYQDAGAAADLSPAVLERTLFHGNNSYYIPHFLATAYSCRTNLPPNTAFRGFGGPQGMFVIEAAIHQAARELGIAASDIQKANLLQQGDRFPYGQPATECQAIPCWEKAAEQYDLSAIQKDITIYNADNQLFKKGMALMPICFGISFTNTQMNQARALVHVYHDGSIGISTGAVEMGQGVNTKLVQIAAALFSVSPERVRIETTNTTRVANTSPSAASATTDLNGKALADACSQIWLRLRQAALSSLTLPADSQVELRRERVFANGQATDLHWEQLIQQAFRQRINLSAKGHYATPAIHFDQATEKGHPFAYHVYGTAITIAKVDCVRGTYEIESVKVVHDYGASMNRLIDLGQTEGGIVQGIGWMTMEELLYNEEGRLLSNALSTYKIPDIYAVPKSIEVQFLKSDGVEEAAFRSKAVGEPPLMYGIGAYFAIRNAVLAFNLRSKAPLSAPITPEKVLMGLYG